MMEAQLLQPSWPLLFTSSLDHTGLYSFPMDISMDDPRDFSSSFVSEESSGISFDSYFAAMNSPDSLVEFPTFSVEEQVKESIAHIMEGVLVEPISSGDCGWMEESEREGNLSSQLTCKSDVWTPPCPSTTMEQRNPSTSTSCTMFPSIETMMCLTLPAVGSAETTDNQLWLSHLLRAFGEAVENGHQELKEVIIRRINEKIDPLGEPLERVAFNLFQFTESQGNYLRQQSAKNFDSAFTAFYQWYPHGRFAHFTANSAILEAMPSDVDTIHIVDFDMGEGIQWPPLIEAINRKGKKTLRLTSIKSQEEPQWNFEDTKRRLYDHARSLGLGIRVEEMELEDLASEIKRMKKRGGGGGREWLAFNLMVALPHMGRRPNNSYVTEFLRVAKDLLSYSAGNRGIITFGDGEAGNYSTTCTEYASFFNSRCKHYQALFESVECNFPVYLPEARMAMESLFIAPYVSSHSWFQQWQDTMEGHAITGLEGWRMSRASLIEAKELLNQQESSYKVFMQGKENEMVLEWRGIPLVRVSSWT